MLALVVIAVSGLAAVLVVGASPREAAAAAFAACLGSPWAVQESLVKTVPLMWCGLAVALSFRAGVWNIGAEGQLVIGAIAATAAGLLLPPGWYSVPGVLLAGAAGGAAWAGIAAALRSYAGVNEVLSTILLNLVAQAVLGWVVHGPLQESSGAYPQSDLLPEQAWLAQPLQPGRLHSGLLVVLVATVFLTLALRRTGWGLGVRAVGDNPEAARSCGLPVARIQGGALMISGALAGLGGAVEVAGITHRLFESLSPGWGYSAIAVALLGNLEPVGVAFAAALFGGMAAASGGMQRGAGVPAVAALLIQGLVVVALAWLSRRERP
jgi:simple sugar transport system permease protein